MRFSAEKLVLRDAVRRMTEREITPFAAETACSSAVRWCDSRLPT